MENFSDILIQEGVLEQFIDNIRDKTNPYYHNGDSTTYYAFCDHSNTYIDDYFHGFNWARSPQGHVFWEDIFTRYKYMLKVDVHYDLVQYVEGTTKPPSTVSIEDISQGTKGVKRYGKF